MQFIKSLVLLIVAFVALSFAADSTVYKSFTVQDTTNNCNFDLGAVVATGNCVTNKCGTTPTDLAYQITQSEANANTEKYTISAYSANVCTGTAAGSQDFTCTANEAVSVTITEGTESVNIKVTCVPNEESSSGASSIALGLTALVGVVGAVLL